MRCVGGHRTKAKPRSATWLSMKLLTAYCETPMTYDPKWRIEDERRNEWLERCYQQDGRRDPKHSKHGTYTGLVDKWGHLPWKVQ